MTHLQELRRKIESRQARAGVVGLGYVGLPLAVELAHAGFTVTGIDVLAPKVDAINRGESYVQDVPTAVLNRWWKRARSAPPPISPRSRELDTINICVPTPLRKTKDPDMSYIVSSCQEIAKHFHAGMLVILESTTYPGTTDELMLPMFEQGGLKVGEDFLPLLLAGARGPGQPQFQTKNIPKVVGGITPACTEAGRGCSTARLSRPWCR